MNHSHYMKAAIALLFCLPLTLQAATPVKRTATPAKKAVATATTAKKDICLQLYSVRDLLSGVNKDGQADAAYTALLKRLHAMGYTSVEAAWYDQGKGTFYNRPAADFKRDIEAAGMKVLSSHVGHGLTAEEIAADDYTPELSWWKKCIADHKAAGMKYIVNPAIGLPKTLKELDLYCRYLNAVGKLCKEAGLGFGYHNHNYEFEKVEGQVMYDYMLTHTSPEYVFFQMDMYWAVRGAASPVDYFNRFPGRFHSFHCKDNREIGQSGMVGWDAIFNNAKTAGLEFIVAEIEQYSVPVEESVKRSADYLLAAPFVRASYPVK